MDVVEQGARRVGRVGDMRPAAGQPPDHVAVDGAEEDLAAPRPLARSFVGVEDPFELGSGEVGIEQQAGAGGDEGLVARGAQLGAEPGGAAVLPDDGAAERAAGGAFPDECGLALVSDPDSRDVGWQHARPLDRAAAGGGDGRPDVVGIVLDPSRAREVLGILLLGRRDEVQALVEDDGAARGRALVDRQNVGHRIALPPAPRVAAAFALDTAKAPWRQRGKVHGVPAACGGATG